MPSNLTIFNPFDPELCFLPAATGVQLMIARYVEVGTLAVFVWELLNNIPSDYRLLSKHQIRFPTITFFISRICSLAFVISTTVFQTAPVHSCYGVDKSLAVLFFLSVTSTSLLFYFRTRAVFSGNPWIVAFFAALWLAVAAASSTLIFGIEGSSIGPTNYCIGGQGKPFVAAATIVPLINDGLVFLAITWHLLCHNSCEIPCTVKNVIKSLVFGNFLPVFSKAILQDGQAYYLITSAVSLAAVIASFNHSIPDPARTVFAIPNVIIMNIMACRVFKIITFESYKGNQVLISRELRTEIIPLPAMEGESSRRTKQVEDAACNMEDNAITNHWRRETHM